MKIMREERKTPIFDDVGSYPLPKGVKRDSLPQGEDYENMVKDALVQKIKAGVDAPTYPQFRDMIKMFMDPIEDPEKSETPYLVKKEDARILELEVLDAVGKELEKEGTRLEARVCVTGPVELYLSAFGATEYADILQNLAQSVSRFLEASKSYSNFDVIVASVDEPSLGISPNVVFREEEISNALDIATRSCKDIDCEVHLHSPLMADLCARVPGINVIGVESASNPDYLKLVDKKTLEDHDSYIRAGIARTDIDGMVARLNDQLGVNLWTDPKTLEMEIMKMESSDLMETRLEGAHRIFGDRIKYAGPDCGLGSWPSQEMTSRYLANCKRAIQSFRAKHH